jgi:hypothetical protein
LQAAKLAAKTHPWWQVLILLGFFYTWFDKAGLLWVRQVGACCDEIFDQAFSFCEVVKLN